MRSTLFCVLASCALNVAATGIEKVSMHADAGGEPGAEVSLFAPEARTQHFKIKLDELKVGSHDYTVEFWMVDTFEGGEEKLTEFKSNGLIANEITTNVTLPRDWPTGWFRLDVLMDGQKIGTHRYVVSQPWEKQSVTIWKLYQDDGQGGAGQQVEQFSARDRQQHFEIQSSGYLKRGAQLQIVYTALATSAGNGIQVQTVDYTVPNDDSVFNILTSNVSLPRDWPVGTYEIALYEGKRQLGAHRYQIVE